MIRVAIADDHPTFIRGIKDLLTGRVDIQLVASYQNGKQVLDELKNDLPHVLLLDIQMPKMAGDEIVSVLRKNHPQLKILILTNFDSTFYIENLLRLGVNGYLLKTTDGEIIVSAVHAVVAGEEFIDKDLKEKIEDYLQYRSKVFKSKLELTTREKEIVQLIVNGLTTQEIAEDLSLNFRTIENYRQNILLKLDARNVAEMVKKAIMLGIVSM